MPTIHIRIPLRSMLMRFVAKYVCIGNSPYESKLSTVIALHPCMARYFGIL